MIDTDGSNDCVRSHTITITDIEVSYSKQVIVLNMYLSKLSPIHV